MATTAAISWGIGDGARGGIHQQRPHPLAAEQDRMVHGPVQLQCGRVWIGQTGLQRRVCTLAPLRKECHRTRYRTPLPQRGLPGP